MRSKRAWSRVPASRRSRFVPCSLARAISGSVISVANGGRVKKGEAFVQWDPYNVPILSEKAGKVKFLDIIEGVTMKQEVDETTGQEAMVIIEHKEDLHPQIVIVDDKGEAVANYP